MDPAATEREIERYERLAEHLAALASPTRLHLLHQLRTPRALHEIRAIPSLTRKGERSARPLARQSVTNHITTLQAAGLIKRVRSAGAEEAPRGERYLLNHEQLFAMVDEMRNLSKLRPVAVSASGPSRTLTGEAASPPDLPLGPRLLVAYGRDDGVAFSLEGVMGATWRIGRGKPCEVRLDYDPYLSAVHCSIVRTAQGFAVRDEGSRNGTWVNWTRLEAEKPWVLEAGDLLTVGRSLLVFQQPKGNRLP